MNFSHNRAANRPRAIGRTIVGGIAALFFLATLMPAGPSAAADSEPTTVVESFHDALLTAMKEAESLGLDGRYDRLSGPVDTAFDLERIIRISSGPHWSAASDEMRDRLAEAFRHLTIATYATRFDGYTGERFEVTGERPGPQQTVLVATRIVGSEGEDHNLTYVMKETESRWRIVDVLLDNSISQLAVQISEYRRTLKDSGVDGLIATLNEKADDLLTE